MESRFSSQFTREQWNEIYNSLKNKNPDPMQEFFIENLVWGGNYNDALEFISKIGTNINTSYGETDDIDINYKMDCNFDHYSFNPKWRGGCKKYKPIIEYSVHEYYDILKPRFIGDYRNDSDLRWARDMLVSTYPMNIYDDVMNDRNYEKALMKIRLEILNNEKDLLKRLLRSAYPSQYDYFLFLTIPKFVAEGMDSQIDFTGKEIPIDWESSRIVELLWKNKIPTSGVITIDGINNIIVGNTDEISQKINKKLSSFAKKSKYLKIDKDEDFVSLTYNHKDTQKIYKDLKLVYTPKNKAFMGLIPEIV